MYQEEQLFFLHAQTPVHPGKGTSAGIVDNPVQRESHTGYPKIEASSLKGAIREQYDEGTGVNTNVLFGPADITSNEDAYAGALGFTNARLLLFPVKSVSGLFAWTTSPNTITRFLSDLEMTGRDNSIEIPPPNTIGQNSVLPVSEENGTKNVLLEEFCHEAVENDTTNEIGKYLEQKLHLDMDLSQQLIVLEDDDFRSFTELSTEVTTRTRIDSATGTVDEDGLFNEEYVPEETVFFSLVLASPEMTGKDNRAGAKDILSSFTKNVPDTVQIGANATLGKGIMQLHSI